MCKHAGTLFASLAELIPVPTATEALQHPRSEHGTSSLDNTFENYANKVAASRPRRWETLAKPMETPNPRISLPGTKKGRYRYGYLQNRRSAVLINHQRDILVYCITRVCPLISQSADCECRERFSQRRVLSVIKRFGSIASTCLRARPVLIREDRS